MKPLRVAVAGAGAVVETCHLPAARLCPEIRIVALADRNIARARALAARFGIPEVAADCSGLNDGIDGVLIALPNFLHAPTAIDLLGHGLHVLVEKPMALGVGEAEKMIEAAQAARSVLAVGLVIRHASGARWIKGAIADGLLGTLTSLDIEYGGVFSWPLASSFLFRKEQAGGGVLIDLGSHMLDLAIWWLGKPTLVEYRDDSMGGLEAECRAELSFASPAAPLKCVVSLSRLRSMSNTVRIVGERRTVEWDIATDAVCVQSSMGYTDASVVGPPRPERRSIHELFAEQLRAFARAAAGRGEPMASGESALAVVDLIERCYRERVDLEFSWTRPAV